jgi:hypothetical protein
MNNSQVIPSNVIINYNNIKRKLNFEQNLIICLSIFSWSSFFGVFIVIDKNQTIYIVFSSIFVIFLILTFGIFIRLLSIYNAKRALLHDYIRSPYTRRTLTYSDIRSLDALNLTNNVTNNHINNLYIIELINSFEKKQIDECCICLDINVIGLQNSIFTCNHNNMCVKCMKKLVISNKNLCPQCRSPIIVE